MQTDVLRTEQINLKLTAEELARLERLSDQYAISPQSVLRMLLKKEADVWEASDREKARVAASLGWGPLPPPRTRTKADRRKRSKA